VVSTPDWLKERIQSYYQDTTERSYLANWSGQALSCHYGLSDEHTKSLDEAHENSNRWLADQLGVQEGMRVFDAGCGLGGTAIWLARHRGAQVVGLTIAPSQVVHGQRAAEEQGVADRVTLRVGDYMASGLEPGTFDVVLNLESLCHCYDVDAYLEHAHALLRPGGRYATMDFYPRGSDATATQQIQTVMDGWMMPRWPALNVVEQAMAAAGFADITTADLLREVRRSAEQLVAMASNTLMMMRLQKAIDGKEEPIFEGHVRAAIACSEGMLSGAIDYAAVLGTKPAL
jgi:tocopherol O-methyltransferase